MLVDLTVKEFLNKVAGSPKHQIAYKSIND